MTNISCGLDIGASSIRALIARPLEQQAKKAGAPFLHIEENILGFSESPTKGFSKGVVTNLNMLSDLIEDTVSEAEKIANCRVRKLTVNISGVHMRTFKSRGSIHISDRPAEIRKEDLKRCINSAKLIAMSLDREVIHLIPERFYIDDKIEISDPVGLFGSKLDVDLNIVTSLVSVLQNFTKSINLAGYEVEDVVTSGSAAALAIFDQKELEEGAVIIDFGKDHTEASLFNDGKLLDYFYFPFGSDDLSQVLQERLRIMFKEAEELRIRCGIIMPGSGREDTQWTEETGGNWVDSKSIGAGTRRNRIKGGDSVGSIREISNLLYPRVEEIMQSVYKKIEPFLKRTKGLPHISVIGGASKMDGFIEAIEEIFGVPVDMGRLRRTKDLHDISFACCLGLARYGIRKKLEKKSRFILGQNSFAGRLISRVQSLFSEYF